MLCLHGKVFAAQEGARRLLRTLTRAMGTSTHLILNSRMSPDYCYQSSFCDTVKVSMPNSWSESKKINHKCVTRLLILNLVFLCTMNKGKYNFILTKSVWYLCNVQGQHKFFTFCKISVSMYTCYDNHLLFVKLLFSCKLY